MYIDIHITCFSVKALLFNNSHRRKVHTLREAFQK